MQWRKWCLSPRYSVSAEGEAVRQQYANARFPVHALSITDDELMTLRGTQSLIDLYENAPREVRRLAPADIGARRLGHFGAFRPENEGRRAFQVDLAERPAAAGGERDAPPGCFVEGDDRNAEE